MSGEELPTLANEIVPPPAPAAFAAPSPDGPPGPSPGLPAPAEQAPVVVPENIQLVLLGVGLLGLWVTVRTGRNVVLLFIIAPACRGDAPSRCDEQQDDVAAGADSHPQAEQPDAEQDPLGRSAERRPGPAPPAPAAPPATAREDRRGTEPRRRPAPAAERSRSPGSEAPRRSCGKYALRAGWDGVGTAGSPRSLGSRS